MKLRYAIAAVAAALLTVPSAGHSATARDCGLTQRVDGVAYQVMLARGSAPCATTKQVVYRYLRSGQVSAPWACRHTKGQIYFVACSRGAGVKVHVFAPN
jgi:hypothetical protein